MKMHLETELIQTIPVLTFTPAATHHCPVVFFIPGFGGTKEDGLRLGYYLAEAGCFGISFDPWLQGQRQAGQTEAATQPAENGTYPAGTGLDTFLLFYRVIHRCLADLQTLLAHYTPDTRADVERCGVTGLSLGGYASYLILPICRRC
jgi:dienelactone hydrolase